MRYFPERRLRALHLAVPVLVIAACLAALVHTTGTPDSKPTITRGSVAVGRAAYPVPAGALFVSSSSGNDGAAGSRANPLRTVGAALKRASAGQTIVLRAGAYHERLLVGVGKRVTIQAYPHEAVWFDGSRPVTNWTQHGSIWVSTGWTAQFDHSASFTKGSDAGGFVNSAYPMAAHPDQLFVDGHQLSQVAPGVIPAAGEFSVDYAAQTLTIGTDPAGRHVRASDLSSAILVAGTATLRGFGVRRYATSLAQIGTIYLGGTAGGDTLENLVVDNNATQGLSIGTENSMVDHVTSTNNGMTGMHSNNGSGSTIQNSVITGNNTQHFNAAPSAGGVKITRADGFVIRDNDVENNNQVDGIWTDVTVSHFVITGNTVTGNNGPYGIITEVSDTGIVADNIVANAQYGYTAFDTGNVKVFNNSFSHNSVWDVGLTQDQRRNPDPATNATVPWVVHNVTVSDNRFGGEAMFQFYALDKATNTAVSNMNVMVDGNIFPTRSSGRQPIMIGWGGPDNATVTYYRTPSSLNSGLHKIWRNAQGGAAMTSSLVGGTVESIAVPLPADVATAIGVASGTKHIGTF